MKIVAFSASTSRQSINGILVRLAAARLEALAGKPLDIVTLDLNDYEMPIYSIDKQNEGGIPQAAEAFFAQIGAADALLIGYAEHNGFYTAAWKNTFDWMSRVEMRVFQDKPMVIMAASPGGGGGGNVLKTAETSAPFFGADIRGSVSVGKWYEAYDAETGALTRPDDNAALDAALAKLLAPAA
ncbi:MAG: NAD(P)H-dependent oxidoreductase [Pseudomonadota bacterium]